MTDILKLEISVNETEVEVDDTSIEPKLEKINILNVDLNINSEKIKSFLDTYILFHEGNQDEYIFTCSCGIAGCAGIWEPINIKFRKNTVEWRIPKDIQSKEKNISMGYEFLSKKFYSFNRTQYMNEINRVKEEILLLSRDKIHITYHYYFDLEYTLLKNHLSSFRI